MFTGIVEAQGEVRSVERAERSARLTIGTPFSGLQLGESIAVNGTCLTAAVLAGQDVVLDVMAQTLDHTTLGAIKAGDRVNLERAARLDTRLGGHLVQGHVDDVATVRSIEPDDQWTSMTFALSPALLRYVVPQGSICVDGVSLTVTGVDDRGFSVSLIPTTLRETTLGARAVGDRVNIEVDALGKYIERLLGDRARHTGERP